jgi:hypothetical protein
MSSCSARMQRVKPDLARSLSFEGIRRTRWLIREAHITGGRRFKPAPLPQRGPGSNHHPGRRSGPPRGGAPSSRTSSARRGGGLNGRLGLSSASPPGSRAGSSNEGFFAAFASMRAPFLRRCAPRVQARDPDRTADAAKAVELALRSSLASAERGIGPVKSQIRRRAAGVMVRGEQSRSPSKGGRQWTFTSTTPSR